jgi:Cd2+/Zn2+-exporting ATPase
MNELQVDTGDDSADPDILYLAVNSRYAGRIMLAGTLRDGAAEMVYQLQSSDVRTIMFTDEDEVAAKASARALGFDKYYSGKTYDSKLKLVSELHAGYAGGDKRLLDASTVGIKMSEPGPDLLNTLPEAMPELTVFNSNPARIADAHKLSRQIKDAAHFNFVITLLIKGAAAVLSLAGLCPFWAAVAIESGVKYICASRKLD